MDAFDADALIYAAAPKHPLGARVLALFPWHATDVTGEVAGVGSVLLLPELLSKPMRDGRSKEVRVLSALLARLELRALDLATSELATALGMAYGLHAVDAAHLATAVGAGADRFVTNNRRDFPRSITEIAVTYPDDLPEP